jgi:dienelactone hydrolase
MMEARMRLIWKIAIAFVVVVALAGGGGFLFLLFKPNPKAEVAPPGPSGVRVAEDGLFGNYFPAPNSAATHPAILVLGGSEGGLDSEVRDEAVALQRGGFNALQLSYFNAPGKGSKLERVPLEQFYKALDWLKKQPGTDPNRIGIMGYSKGAEAALLVATRYPGLKAMVLGMPSSVTWDALSMRSYLFGGISSWTQDGKDVPSLAYAKPDDQGTLLSRFANALRDLPLTSPDRIPVERYKGRILMICGERDSLWPSCPMAQDIAARAVAQGAARPDILVYPDAGHGVMGVPMPEDDRRWRGWKPLGGTIHADAEARKDNWPKVMAFLENALPDHSGGSAGR